MNCVVFLNIIGSLLSSFDILITSLEKAGVDLVAGVDHVADRLPSHQPAKSLPKPSKVLRQVAIKQHPR